MALRSTGAMSFNDINVELDREATSRLSMNDVFFRELFERTSGSISLSGGYGKSNAFGLHTGITITRAFTTNGIGRSIAVFGDLMASGTLHANEERVVVYSTARGLPNSRLYEISIPSTYNDNAREEYGHVIAMNAEYLVVTAFYADVGENDQCGIAFVYSTPTGQLLHTLFNPNPAPTIIVDDSPFGDEGDREEPDYFGTSVDISGTNIVIGAYYEKEPNEGRSGAVYCFNAATGVLVNTLAHRDVQNLFGKEVGIDGDTVAVVGDHGFAELFSFSTGALLHTLTDTTASLPYGQGNGRANLGGSISISGDIVAIASVTSLRMVSLFSTSTGNHLRTIHSLYRPTGYERNDFGKSLALDGENLVIGSPSSNNPVTSTPNGIGMCHSYNATTGALVQTIENPTPNTNDNFGHAISIANDQVAISSLGNGGYIYKYTLTN